MVRNGNEWNVSPVSFPGPPSVTSNHLPGQCGHSAMRNSRTGRVRGRGVGPFTMPEDAARSADLRHMTDDRPGITRRRSGRGFSYVAVDGAVVRDKATLQRIRALAIPPAWTKVWICPSLNGHIQATGRDLRGRKHIPLSRALDGSPRPRRSTIACWRSAARSPPSARESRTTWPDRGTFPKEKVLAIIISLLEATVIRVGNEEYARENHLVRPDHDAEPAHRDRWQPDALPFSWQRAAKVHDISLSDRRLARMVCSAAG